MQPAGLDTHIDRAIADPDETQLPPGDYAVLKRRQRRDGCVDPM